MQTKELSGNVTVFSLFVVFSPVVCFDVYYLFVCLLLFCESYYDMLLLHCRYKGHNANTGTSKYRILQNLSNLPLLLHRQDVVLRGSTDD